MRAWVDESGDAGTGGAGSQWLVLVAVCCPEGGLADLSAALAALRARLPPGAMAAKSFSRLSHDAKRGFLAAAAGLGVGWQARAVAFDTRRLVDGPLSRPNLLYNYAFRWTLEQAVGCAAQLGEPADVVFERQTRTGDPERLIDYVRRLERLRVPTIDWRVFGADRLYPVGKGEEVGLFLADAVAHAVFRSLEPDGAWDGLTDPSYFELIAHRVTRVRRFPGR